MKVNEYVSNTINEDILEALDNNAHYLILAGTGAGKTYFVKNTIREFVLGNSKRLLVLTHRASLKKQTRADIDNADMVYGFYDDDDLQVINYQSILEKGNDFLNSFDYIVCDEAHYFTNDSWNERTQDELELIKNSTAIKIYMTATYESFVKLFNKRDNIQILYKQEGLEDKLGNKQKNIRCIYRTSDEEKYLAFIQQRKNKVLSIYSSARKAYESSLKIKGSVFNCSKFNSDYSSYIDNKAMKYLEKNKLFENKVLCSTTAIEGGVDIIDTKLDTIAFSGYFNRDTVEQIAGRKRFNSDEDVLDFVVLEPSKGAKAKRISQLKKDLNNVYVAQTLGVKYALEERKSKSTIPEGLRIEDDEKLTISYIKFEKMRSELNWLYEIKEDGISHYLAKIHGISEIVDIDHKELEADVFERYMGKKMFKRYDEDVKEYIGASDYILQDGFKDLLKFSYGLRAGDGSKGKSIGLKTINAFFDENDIPFMLNNHSEHIYINKDSNKRRIKISYWYLVKL